MRLNSLESTDAEVTSQVKRFAAADMTARLDGRKIGNMWMLTWSLMDHEGGGMIVRTASFNRYAAVVKYATSQRRQAVTIACSAPGEPFP